MMSLRETCKSACRARTPGIVVLHIKLLKSHDNRKAKKDAVKA